MLSWRPTWLTWDCQVPPGSRAAGIAVSRAGRHIRTMILPATVRPIRQGGKRCGGPGKTPAPASSGGKAACPVVRSCRRTSRAGDWLRLTVRARSGVLGSTRRLGPRHGRSWTGRKRTRVLRQLSVPDGRPVQAGVLRWGSQIPRKWLWRISPALVVRSASETGSSTGPRRVCGLCGGLGCQGVCSSQYLLRQPERVLDRV